MEDLLGVGQPRFPINDLHGLWDPEGKKMEYEPIFVH